MEKQDQRPHPSWESPSFNVRFPDGVREKVKELAKREGRSMNSQIVKFIELGLKLAA